MVQAEATVRPSQRTRTTRLELRCIDVHAVGHEICFLCMYFFSFLTKKLALPPLRYAHGFAITYRAYGA